MCLELDVFKVFYLLSELRVLKSMSETAIYIFKGTFPRLCFYLSSLALGYVAVTKRYRKWG